DRLNDTDDEPSSPTPPKQKQQTGLFNDFFLEI
ncbi:unnamed protein product, partial [Rotaria magnacalcarata]